MNNINHLFSLDSSIHFLNHGSFGATPIPVFEAYQDWQRQLERQPVLFLGRMLNDLLAEARTKLAEYLNTKPENLVYIPNATHGVNIIARSLNLHPGDEILTTNHEYGACDYTWEFICNKTGSVYLHQPIELPAHSLEKMADQFWLGVNAHTKVIYLSHITSPTAIRLPVEIICARARQAGILTVIDGAHAPGQIDLDLGNIGSDVYIGNCHKWMMSPKGAGFLYARPEVQYMIEPLVISWGYRSTPQTTSGSQFIDYLSWSGTKDPAAYLSVPAAIQFQRDHAWHQVREECHSLLHETIERICNWVQMPPLYPLDTSLYHQMGIAPLPASVDINILKTKLYDDYQIEVPLIEWNGRKFVRISVQGYNNQADLDALVTALKHLL